MGGSKMKLLLVAGVLSLLLMGCGSDPELRTFAYDGHDYLVWKMHNHRGAVVHSASCEACTNNTVDTEEGYN
jgi:hypothetical protein